MKLAAPYYLFSVGIGLILIAYFWDAITGRNNSTLIDPRMSDKDIEQQLNKSEGSPIPGLIMMAGLLAMLVSVVWRIARFFF